MYSAIRRSLLHRPGRRPGAPEWVPGWCSVGRGGAGGVVQFLCKVVDVPVVWVVFVVAVQLLDKAADMPVLSSPGFVLLGQGR